MWSDPSFDLIAAISLTIDDVVTTVQSPLNSNTVGDLSKVYIPQWSQRLCKRCSSRRAGSESVLVFMCAQSWFNLGWDQAAVNSLDAIPLWTLSIREQRGGEKGKRMSLMRSEWDSSPMGWVWGFICNLEVVCAAPPMGEVMSNGPHQSLKKDGKDPKVHQKPYFCMHQTNLTKGACSEYESILQITVSYMPPPRQPPPTKVTSRSVLSDGSQWASKMCVFFFVLG